MHRAVKKLRQLQTQPLMAEEEAQKGQQLLTPALSKGMRRMVCAAQPVGVQTPVPMDATPQRHRHLLPQVPSSETPKRGKTLSSSGKKEKTPLSCIPVPFTPEDLRGVTFKPTLAKKKPTPQTGPRHLKLSITPESLASQSDQLKKVGPPRTAQQTNPLMASLSREIDKRRSAMNPKRQSSWELKGLEKEWKTSK